MPMCSSGFWHLCNLSMLGAISILLWFDLRTPLCTRCLLPVFGDTLSYQILYTCFANAIWHRVILFLHATVPITIVLTTVTNWGSAIWKMVINLLHNTTFKLACTILNKLVEPDSHFRLLLALVCWRFLRCMQGSSAKLLCVEPAPHGAQKVPTWVVRVYTKHEHIHWRDFCFFIHPIGYTTVSSMHK